MFQNNEKIFGIGTTPTSLGGMAFFVLLDVIPIKSEVRSSLTQVNEKEKIKESGYYTSLKGTVILGELCVEQTRSIEREDLINELQQQLSDDVREICGLDMRNHSLQKTGNLEDQSLFTRTYTGEN